ncbi:MFS transporter [Streptomyces sp. NPDC020883]|uniref:MFS transporter n=1 Tax=Streptomyces sp. NPDC020883 TaxID=3365099 RepID=UPI0037B94EF2
MSSSLRALSEIPRLKTLLPLSLIGRIHLSGLPVALSFLIAGWTDGYTTVGLVTGAMAVGQAVAGPIRGRVADRNSASTLLFVTGGGYAVGLVALVLAALLLPAGAWPAAVVISFFTGLTLPPISQISRALWPRLAKGDVRESLFTLEATGYEIVSMAGPLLAAGVVTLSGGAAAVVVCAVLAAGGSLLFGLVLRAAALDRAQPPATTGAEPGTNGKQRSLLRDQVFVRAILVPFFLMAALFSVDLSVVAWGRDRGTPGIAGVLIALFALGSALGGLLAVGRGGKRNSSLGIGGLAVGIGVLALLLPPAADATPLWLLAVAMMVTGSVVSPSLGASNSRIGDLTPEHRRAEAFGWLATATTAGAAAMLPLSGRLLDLAGPAASLGSGAVAAVLSASLALTLPKRTEEPEEVEEAEGARASGEPGTGLSGTAGEAG